MYKTPKYIISFQIITINRINNIIEICYIITNYIRTTVLLYYFNFYVIRLENNWGLSIHS